MAHRAQKGSFIAAKNRHKIARLRSEIARFEPVVESGPHVLTGFSEIDGYLQRHVAGAGLALGGVHEIIGERSGDMSAALGFADYLSKRFIRQGADEDASAACLLYGQTHASVRENGQPYGAALSHAENLIYLDGVKLPDLMWAGEEALSCEAIGCIILASVDEAPDFTFSRRLSMAARSVERPLIMALGAAAAGTASAATSQWRVKAIAHNGWYLKLTRLRISHTQNPPHQGWQVFPQAQKISSQTSADAARDSFMALPSLSSTQSASQ